MGERSRRSRESIHATRCSLRIAVLGTLVVLLIAGCGANAGSRDASTGSGGTRDLPRGAEPVDLDPQDFSTTIDNPYWPMDPGTRWTYSETDQAGLGQKVVVTVSDQTKEVSNGVTARVVRDTVTENGEIIEDTFDWYAQDRTGNVWYLGEKTAEFENGKLATTEGSFEAGVDGAQPGIILPADPEPGLKYRQEYYEGKAEDNGEVLSTHEMVQSPFGRSDNALLTKDTDAIEPNVLEYKLYARGVGPVLTLGVSGGPGSREELLDRDSASQEERREAGKAPLGTVR